MSDAPRRLLALDSSTQVASVVALEATEAESRVCSEQISELQRSHAPGQIGMIADAMQEAGWEKSDLQAIVVVRGPGSFTGVRIALGTARGLALASNCPCVAVGTLEAMAAAVGPHPAPLVPLLGAGRGEYYAARYAVEGGELTELLAPRLIGEEEVWEWPEDRFVVGERVEPPQELDAGRYLVAPKALAASAARLVALRGVERSGSLAPLSPLYVRPSDAELARRARES